jgi:nitrogen fixation protein FixH
MVVIAVRDPSFAVEKDYYKKGVEWDLQRRIAKESEALGWKADLSLKAEMPNQPLHQIRLALLDAQKKPIDGASIAIQAFHNANAAKRLTLTLKKAVDGRYEAALMANRPGLWIFRIEAQKDGKRFFQEQRQMLLLPKEKVAPTTHKGIKT